MRHAVYAGTFDPFTKGHEHILNQALPLFDQVTLAIGVNPAKKTMFHLSDRMDMLNDLALSNVQVRSFENEYLVNFAQSIGAQFVIRGIRNVADFEYEHAMAQVNLKINPDVRTVFFMADPEFAAISSSMVKSLIGPEGWEYVAKPYVPIQIAHRFVTLVRLQQY